MLFSHYDSLLPTLPGEQFGGARHIFIVPPLDALGRGAANRTPLATIQVRGVDQDPQSGADVPGAWKPISFVLQPDANGQAPALPGATDPLTAGDQVAATSFLASQQAIDDALEQVNAAMGYAGALAGEIVTPMGTYSALSDENGGRIATGSVYGFENGTLPAPDGLGIGPSGDERGKGDKSN